MKNFDEERRAWSQEGRTFQLGGAVFVAREHIRPEVLAAFEDATTRKEGRTLAELIQASDNAFLTMIEGGEDVQGQAVPAIPDPNWTPAEGQTEADRPTIQPPPLLVPVPDSARARYLAVRADPAGLIEFDQLAAVMRWLMEANTDRPTEPSPPSGGSPATTSTTSTATSSPPVAPAPTPSPSVPS